MDFRSACTQADPASDEDPAHHDAAFDSAVDAVADIAPGAAQTRRLAALNRVFRDLPAHRIVRQALARARRPILSSSFGPDSAALIRLVLDVDPTVPVVWVDNGFNTESTQRFAQSLAREWSLDLRIYRPRLDRDRIIARFGTLPAPGDPQHHAFSELVKLEPFRRALRELQPDTWLTGIRSNETMHRRQIDIASAAPDGVVRVAPLLHWDDERTARFLHARELPNGHDYHDILCAAAPGQSIRRECGLHDRL